MEQAEKLAHETPRQPEERFAREPQQQPQQRPVTMEQIIADAPIPERAKAWLRQHPEYMTDKTKNDFIGKMHHVAEYQAGGVAYTDAYFERLEDLLGIRAKPNGNGQHVPSPQRQPALSRQQAPASPQVSAPPARQAPSMTTGRPAGQPTQLTNEERTLARSLGLSDSEYAANKAKLIQLKASGWSSMEDDKPYVIESPTRIRLMPIARELAKMHGMSEIEMAQHLLQQHALQDAGMVQKDGESWWSLIPRCRRLFTATPLLGAFLSAAIRHGRKDIPRMLALRITQQLTRRGRTARGHGRYIRLIGIPRRDIGLDSNIATLGMSASKKETT
jgi:hypothetical protein